MCIYIPEQTEATSRHTIYSQQAPEPRIKGSFRHPLPQRFQPICATLAELYLTCSAPDRQESETAHDYSRTSPLGVSSVPFPHSFFFPKIYPTEGFTTSTHNLCHGGLNYETLRQILSTLLLIIYTMKSVLVWTGLAILQGMLVASAPVGPSGPCPDVRT